MLTRRTAAALAAVAVIGIIAGCNKGDSTSGNAPPPGGWPQGPGGGSGPPGGGRVEEVEPFLAGKKVFNANCARCHSTTAAGGEMAGGGAPQPGAPPGGGPGMGGPRPGGNRGPNLGKTGANPEHTAQWLTEFIKDPKSKRENARMPPFGNMSDADLKAVAEFLASLK